MKYNGQVPQILMAVLLCAAIYIIIVVADTMMNVETLWALGYFDIRVSFTVCSLLKMRAIDSNCHSLLKYSGYIVMKSFRPSVTHFVDAIQPTILDPEAETCKDIEGICAYYHGFSLSFHRVMLKCP